MKIGFWLVALAIGEGQGLEVCPWMLVLGYTSEPLGSFYIPVDSEHYRS